MAVNNLYVTYDDDGTQHFHINDAEVTEDEFKLQHPMMKGNNGNGRNLNSAGSGRNNHDGVTADAADAKEQQRQRLRDLKQAQAVANHVEGQAQD